MTRANWEESSANWQELYRQECERRERSERLAKERARAAERRIETECRLRDEYKGIIEEWQTATLHETPDSFSKAQATEDQHWNSLVDQKDAALAEAARWKRKARKGDRARKELKLLRGRIRALEEKYSAQGTYHLYEGLTFIVALELLLQKTTEDGTDD